MHRKSHSYDQSYVNLRSFIKHFYCKWIIRPIVKTFLLLYEKIYQTLETKTSAQDGLSQTTVYVEIWNHRLIYSFGMKDAFRFYKWASNSKNMKRPKKFRHKQNKKYTKLKIDWIQFHVIEKIVIIAERFKIKYGNITYHKITFTYWWSRSNSEQTTDTRGITRLNNKWFLVLSKVKIVQSSMKFQ